MQKFEDSEAECHTSVSESLIIEHADGLLWLEQALIFIGLLEEYSTCGYHGWHTITLFSNSLRKRPHLWVIPFRLIFKLLQLTECNEWLKITACVKLYNSNLLINQKCFHLFILSVYGTEIMGSLISQKGVYAVFPFVNQVQWCRVLV